MSSVFAWREQPSTMWREFVTSGKVKANSTAAVQKRRDEGRDNSTIVGLSKKADATRVPHGGAYTRAKPSMQANARPEGKSGRLRAILLAYGALTHKQLAETSGFPYKSIGGLLQNDIASGRIRVIVFEVGEPRKFELVAAQ